MIFSFLSLRQILWTRVYIQIAHYSHRHITAAIMPHVIIKQWRHRQTAIWLNTHTHTHTKPRRPTTKLLWLAEGGGLALQSCVNKKREGRGLSHHTHTVMVALGPSILSLCRAICFGWRLCHTAAQFNDVLPTHTHTHSDWLLSISQASFQAFFLAACTSVSHASDVWFFFPVLKALH